MCAGIYLVERDRSEEIPTLVRRLRKAGAEQGLSKHDLQGMIDELRGYQAWKAGELRQAARLWERASRPNRWDAVTTWSEFHYRGAIWRGDLYRALGELEKAEGWYVAAWQHPVAHERLGRLYETMNRPGKAAAAYERFVAAWKDADPALQDRVQQARERLGALASASNPRRAVPGAKTTTAPIIREVDAP